MYIENTPFVLRTRCFFVCRRATYNECFHNEETLRDTPHKRAIAALPLPRHQIGTEHRNRVRTAPAPPPPELRRSTERSGGEALCSRRRPAAPRPRRAAAASCSRDPGPQAALVIVIHWSNAPHSASTTTRSAQYKTTIKATDTLTRKTVVQSARTCKSCKM